MSAYAYASVSVSASASASAWLLEVGDWKLIKV